MNVKGCCRAGNACYAEQAKVPCRRERVRVLVVEDEPTMASALDDALTHERLTVDTADGRDALGKVHIEQAYDLILLDLMMPHMDGMTFLRTIRAEGYTMPIPVSYTHLTLPTNREV